ncbi:hypothetical protein [Neosynechococcus sphagnicola]|uniref:hypothetical protein n=1 Tax=Neosynechococcus sphagnicola TaxID=1501145 RepID=UPI0030841CEA
MRVQPIDPTLPPAEIPGEVQPLATVSPSPYVLWDTPETEALRYDPLVITHHYDQHPRQVWERIMRILWPSLLFVLSLWWDRLTGQTQDHQRQQAVQLRELLTQLGPAYIKIGQALSTRPDLVPPRLSGGTLPTPGSTAPLPQRRCIPIY